MQFRISKPDAVLVGTLDPTGVAADFARLLPLHLTLSDFAGKEKVADLPRALDVTGMPEGYRPSAGDVCYYAPWGNLAIFYKDAGHARGLVKLGRIDEHLAALIAARTPLEVTFERVGDAE